MVQGPFVRGKGLTSALVVGAGPAGTSAALALLARGMDVTVLERNPGVGPRVCGAFLGAEALRHLDILGLGKRARAQGVSVPSVWVSVGQGKERRVNFPTPGLALSRLELEQMLVEAVLERGGNVRWSVVAKPAGPSAVTVSGPGLHSGDPREISGDRVIWADGRFSDRPLVSGEKETPAWFGWNALFTGVSQKPGEMSLHFVPDGYVGVLSFKDGTTNICGLKRRRAVPLDWGRVFDRTREQSDRFSRRTEGATLLTPWRGVGPLPFTGGLRPVDSVFRVGDAAAVGDPFMGEGIGRALASGPLLAQTLDRPPTADESSDEAFRHRWRSLYGKRFLFGIFFRWTLERSGFLGQALAFFLTRSPVVDLFLPFFHKTGNETVQGVECLTRESN